MDLLSKLFEPLSKTVGTPAIILVVASFIVIQFGDAVIKTLQTNSIPAVAGTMLFVLGAFAGFVRVLNDHFDVKAGRGFVDGLVAGLPAGVLGGVLYALHRAATDPPQAAFARVLLLTILVGGFWGLALSLCHPRVKINWAERLTAILVYVLAIMLPIGTVIGTVSQNFLPGDWVRFEEVVAMSGAFVLVLAAFPLARSGRGAVFLATRLGVLAVFVALMTWTFPKVFGDVRLDFGHVATAPFALVAIGAVLTVASAAYFLTTTDHPGTRILDGAAEPRRRPAKAR